MSSDLEENNIIEKKGWKTWGAAGGIAGALWVALKFAGKWLLLLGKPLLTFLKVSKFAGTFISMIATIAIYAMVYGWKFAIGLVLLIAIHEMGHVMGARAVGMPTSMPMFIPFVGAFVQMKRESRSPVEEYVLATGGPLFGILAGIACLALYGLTDWMLWMVLANVSFTINLFNLIPFGSLDGGRMTSTLGKWPWIVGAIVFGLFTAVTMNPMMLLFFLLGMMQVVRAFRNPDALAAVQATGSMRWIYGGVYLLMVTLCGWLTAYSHQQLPPVWNYQLL
ncbi:site-2 protease family protein [Heliobacterium gestii]|uniref:Site-2 protease family protein n=1 Tax=Heliomicrobium gestii TaxID=2699 RepID=A0A845L6U8_HELGE|nr:site-2 protease family protein [Heliomicrobium gestii]MBM7866915.1 Zn-dependent protease [Heliomicrobium gestii]MZP42342.1 site-2 protease family protein [Heliomicrobium gestii]